MARKIKIIQDKKEVDWKGGFMVIQYLQQFFGDKMAFVGNDAEKKTLIKLMLCFYKIHKG